MSCGLFSAGAATRRSRLFAAALSAVAIGLCAAAPAAAQEQTGTIEGIVRHAAGAPATQVRVEARNLSTGMVVGTVTDTEGFYLLPALAPGRYDVTADPTGPAPGRVGQVALFLGWLLRVDLALGQSTAEPTAPEALATLPELTQSASFANIRDERLERQPRGRDYTSVTLQAPGANYEFRLAGLSIDGASTSENRFFIDGLDTGRLDVGLPGKEMPTDFVEEVQVKSSGYMAEYGGSTGAAVNVVTRSGTSRWRGEAILYFASDVLGGNASARARPENGPPPLDQGRPVLVRDSLGSTADLVRFPDDRFERVEPGVIVSGPLAKDRLWLFAGYLPRLEHTTREVTFLSTGETKVFEREDTAHVATLGITARLSDAVQARVAGHSGPYHRTGDLPDIRGTDNPAVDYAALGRDEPSLSVSGSIDWMARQATAVGVRAGYFRSDAADTGVPNQVRHTFSRSNIGLPGVPPEYQAPLSFTDIPSNESSTRDLQSRLSLRVEASHSVHLAGRHLFKGGVQFDRLANDLLSGEQQPVVTLAWNGTLTTSDGRRVRGQYGFYRARQMLSAGDVTGATLGVFLQDRWTLGDRLALNLGLRTERENVPSYASGPGYARHAIVFGFGDKLAPRAGFAWDLRGNGTWKAYGSWGLFYDTMKLDLPRSLFGGLRWIDSRYTLDTYDWPSIGGGSCPPSCPGTFIEALDFAPPSNDPAHNLIDPGLEPMRSRELTLGVQRRLGGRGSGGIRYVHKRLDRAVEDVGVLVPAQGYQYFIANPGFGLAEYTLGQAYPAQPRAQRDYDGLEVEASTRFAQVFLHGSYLWSRLHGNYSGLASSDDNVVAPNVTSAFDLLQQSFDEHAQPVLGGLATDRPHQFKAQAIYTAPFGTTLSANVIALSGTPVTRRVVLQNAVVFYRGRGSDGRTDTLSQLDLYLQQEFRLGRERRLQLTLNVLNVLDQDAVTSVYPQQYATNIPITPDDFFDGFDVAELAAQYGLQGDPRFLMPQTYQPTREVWVRVKLLF